MLTYKWAHILSVTSKKVRVFISTLILHFLFTKLGKNNKVEIQVGLLGKVIRMKEHNVDEDSSIWQCHFCHLNWTRESPLKHTRDQEGIVWVVWWANWTDLFRIRP